MNTLVLKTSSRYLFALLADAEVPADGERLLFDLGLELVLGSCLISGELCGSRLTLFELGGPAHAACHTAQFCLSFPSGQGLHVAQKCFNLP